MMRESPVSGAVLAGCSTRELEDVERSALSSFEALAGGPSWPVRFDASCHLLVARRP